MAIQSASEHENATRRIRQLRSRAGLGEAESAELFRLVAAVDLWERGGAPLRPDMTSYKTRNPITAMFNRLKRDETSSERLRLESDAFGLDPDNRDEPSKR